MSFPSVLYRSPADELPPPPGPPRHFGDLHLDQIVAEIAAVHREYDLAPLFHVPLRDPELVAFRQDAMRDVEAEPVAASALRFGDRMRAMRAHRQRAGAAASPDERDLWLFAAALVYQEGVNALLHGLASGSVRSQAFTALREYLEAYTGSAAFVAFAAESDRVGTALGTVRFTLDVRGNAVTVRALADEADYGILVEQTFARFRRRGEAPTAPSRTLEENLNHVETEILERVALLHPGPFTALRAFVSAERDYVSGVLARFEREVHFYLAYLTVVGTVRGAGLSFSYPRVSRKSKAMGARDAFDLALALALRRAGRREPVVCNDYRLDGDERILVITGPNQGGKTTFARMLGQAQYLASLGCPVPGAEVELPLCDGILTHFERPEDPGALRGKLQDDLIRIRDLLRGATPWTLLILNEAFSSTTAHDALVLGRKVLAAVSALDAPTVWVTFLSDLASFDRKTVSVVSEVDPADPAVRTFKLSRRPADGLAYAKAIAEKHGVTYTRLRERLGS